MHQKIVRALRPVLIAAFVTGVAAGCSDAAREPMGESHDELLARADVLWPSEHGRATVRVCWADPILATAYRAPMPPPSFTSVLAWGKDRVRAAIEREWNGRTRIRFVGFRDCRDDASFDFRLVPIDSNVTPPCGGRGQACAEGLGTELRGRNLYLNLFFGLEVLYTSLYYATAGESAKTELGIDYWWLPQFCRDELIGPWHPRSPSAERRLDVRQPHVFAALAGIYDNCLQANAIHELGHAAGFGHEQYRTDAPAARAACEAHIRERNITDDFTGRYRDEVPMGPFDFESIMSYCRRDKRAMLTETDVVMTNAAYRYLSP